MPELARVDTLSESQIEDLTRLYHVNWWSSEREPEDIRKMLQHTPFIVGIVEADSDKLVGFARVLTDFTYRATVYDVIVDKAFQGTGLGRRLMNEIMGDRRLGSIEHIELQCLEELIPFYEKWGYFRSEKLVRMVWEREGRE